MSKKPVVQNPAESRGDRLKAFLKARFQTVSAAAEAYGKAGSYFNNYLNGQSMPGGEVLTWLAEQGLNVNWLLSGEGSMLSGAGAEPYHPPSITREPQTPTGTGIPHLGDAMAGFPESVLNTAKNQLLEVTSDRVTITIDATDGRHIIVIANRPK